MRDKNQLPDVAGSDDVDLDRREVLVSLAKYSATIAGASTVVLSASASVSLASISGGGPKRDPGGPSRDPGVGRSSSDGTRGQVPSENPGRTGNAVAQSDEANSAYREKD